MFRLKQKTKVHFIGIGGIGMSGIAEILLAMNYEVSGSDLHENENVLKLRRKGAKIFLGHNKENIQDASVVVYSSAVKADNVEFQEAQNRKIPIIKRAEMLCELSRLRYVLAVAGSHGKTTTTSFLATILHESGLDPTHVIGGIVENLGGHAKLGKSHFIVAEADESDGTFLLMNPLMSVITNIDDDHLDYYGTKENLVNAFETFANKIPFYGLCILNAHDQSCLEIASRMNRPYATFGIFDDVDRATFVAKNVRIDNSYLKYDLYYKSEFKHEITLNLPGKHNVLNSLGAIAIAYELEVDFPSIAKSIIQFKGVGRRFEKIFENNSMVIIDDYAHHPTEIIATISAAQEMFKTPPIVFFQPHRFTRTQSCWNEFLICFEQTQKCFIMPIYPASERPIVNITSDHLVQEIKRSTQSSVEHILLNEEILLAKLKEINRSLDAKTPVLFLGAGSIGKTVRNIVKRI